MTSYKYPLVEVVWIDASHETGWTDPNEISVEVKPNAVTVGFLIRKPSKKSPIYVIASSIGIDDDDTDVNGVIKIPKAWVKEINEK